MSQEVIVTAWGSRLVSQTKITYDNFSKKPKNPMSVTRKISKLFFTLNIGCPKKMYTHFK